jgi:FkbM family methyltransferase
MLRVEKKSFIRGILLCSAIFGLWKASLLFLSPRLDSSSDFITDFIICLIITLLCLTSYGAIFRNWTNRLAYEMYRESLKSKMALLKEGVDDCSIGVLDYVYACINSAVFWSIPFTKITMPQHQYDYRKDWTNESVAIRQKCVDLGIGMVCPEVFYFHHGLRFANEKILTYIKDRDIFDCGAYVGDSALVLNPYTNGTIYSFEFSKKTIEKFREVIKKSGIMSGSVLIEAAIGDRSAVLNVRDTGKHNNCLINCLDGDAINVTTIDEEIKNRKIRVGFIKADLEGHGFRMIKGAINTLKAQRPVLSIGIYHNYEELFEIKPFLQKEVKDYIYEFQLHRFSEGKFVELTLFCYPKELGRC